MARYFKEKETLYIYELVYQQYISEEDPSAILYPRPYILILIFIAGGLSFYSIFQYRNRINQLEEENKKLKQKLKEK